VLASREHDDVDRDPRPVDGNDVVAIHRRRRALRSRLSASCLPTPCLRRRGASSRTPTGMPSRSRDSTAAATRSERPDGDGRRRHHRRGTSRTGQRRRPG
jgi:hypothetical protein